MLRRLFLGIGLVLALLIAACGGGGGDAEPTSTSAPPAATGEPSATEPPSATPGVAVPATAPAAQIELPGGFTAYAVATGFFRPTSVTVADDGTIFVSERHGRVARLGDADGDGVFEEIVTWAEPPDEVTGILATPAGVYISSRGRVLLARDADGDGAADEPQEVVTGLPNGRHQNNGLALGPDGKLYITNGSTCDDCNEGNERSASILQANADGSELRVYASGLRNPYDLVFDASGRLWATDNGSDEPCASVDELNLIVDGGDYGWPYGEDGCDPFNDGIAPTADLGLHTASTGIDVYQAAHFPSGYTGSLFATLWGSLAFGDPTRPPSLLRIVAGDGENGQPAEVEEFGTGFVHPIDVAVDHDGTLLVLDYGIGSNEDDTSGTLYRIVYTGG